MKLNSLSLIIVLSLFAAIFSNTITYTIDELSNNNTQVCITPADSFILQIKDFNAVFDSYKYENILEKSEGNDNVYELISKNIGQSVEIYFSHRLNASSSFFGPHRPHNTLRIHVKEQC